jgi:hypothetical protein
MVLSQKPNTLRYVVSLSFCLIELMHHLLQSGEVVALKKVPLRKLEDGIPNTALR